MNQGYTTNQGYPGYAPNPYFEPMYDKQNQTAQPVNFEAQTRLNFIRKVYGILAVQLLISTIFVLIGTFFVYLRDLDKTLQSIFLAGAIISIVLIYTMVIAIVCCVGRTFPVNYICLFIFTLAESFLLMLFSAKYTPTSVLLALAMTAAATIGISIYAMTTKTDFTPWVGVLWMVLFGFIVFSILFLFFIYPLNKQTNKTYYYFGCIVGLIIYSIYLVLDTQLMMGNFGLKYEIDDYIIAALNLYLDIINLFIYLLKLFGESK